MAPLSGVATTDSEEKQRKVTTDCLSASNRCETVRVPPTQTARGPVILRSARSNVALEIMLLLNIPAVFSQCLSTSCVAVSHTGDNVQNNLSLSLALSILSSVTLTFLDFYIRGMNTFWQKQQPQSKEFKKETGSTAIDDSCSVDCTTETFCFRPEQHFAFASM